MLMVFESQCFGCWLCCIFVICFLFGFQLSYGELVNNLMIGNFIVLVLGNVVIVDLLGVDFIYFNFVGLVCLKGCEVFFKVVVVSFNFDVEFGYFLLQVQVEIDKWGYDDFVDNICSQVDSIYLKVFFVGGRIEWFFDFLVVFMGGVFFVLEGVNYIIGIVVYLFMVVGYG